MTGKLIPSTVLTCAPELRLKLTPDLLRVTVGERTVGCSARALGLLEAFRQPVTVEDAIAGQRVSGAQDWIDLMTEIHRLRAIGALVEPGQVNPANAPSYGFAALPVHTAMLNDRDRSGAYLQAIRATVRPGDVVVEIGAGTGILSIAAAQAGAKHVYAIEATGIASVAERMIAANGATDAITLLKGWSTQIELPERADVLISEIIGDGVFEERILEALRDARQRMLKPDARLIPERMQVFALLMSAPAEQVSLHKPTADAAARWHEWYELDFTPLADAGATRDIHRLIPADGTSGWQILAAPALLADLDLARIETFRIETEAKATITSDGDLNAVMLYPDVWLAPTHRLSRHPAAGAQGSHWNSLISLLARPFQVAVGDAVGVQYRHGGGSTVLTARKGD